MVPFCFPWEVFGIWAIDYTPSCSSRQEGLARRFFASEADLKKTVLYDFHVANGGKMVPFAGWSMRFSTRTQSWTLQSTAGSMVDSLKYPICCRDKDLAHIEEHMKALKSKGGDVSWHIHDERSLLALQANNTGAVALSANPVYHTQSKHIDLDVHFVREKVASGQMRVNYVPALHQLADGFTKPLSKAAFEDFRSKVGDTVKLLPASVAARLSRSSLRVSRTRSHQRLLTGALMPPPETVLDANGKFVGAESAAAIWNMVLQLFANRSTTAAMSLHCKLQSLKKGNNNMCVYLTRVKEICDALASCGYVVSHVGHVASILKGLPREYQPFMAVITTMKDTLSLDDLYTVLLDAEAQLAGFDDQLEYLPMSAHLAQREVVDLGFNASCVANLATWSIVAGIDMMMILHVLRPILDPTKAAGQSQANIISNSGEQHWVVDSGATHHLMPDATKVLSPTEFRGPGKLTVGNGVSLDIRSIGSSVLPSTSSRALLLNNLLHVPSMIKNLLSVSKLARDNVVYIGFHAATCYVRDGQLKRFFCVEEWMLVTNQFGVTIKVVQSDWGGEYRSISSMLANSSIPMKYWSYAMVTTTHLINRLPTKHGTSSIAGEGIVHEGAIDEVTCQLLFVAPSPVDTDSPNEPPDAADTGLPDESSDVAEASDEHDIESGFMPIDLRVSTRQPEHASTSSVQPTHNSHSMLTRNKCGVFKPKTYSSYFEAEIPSTVQEAMQSAHSKEVVQSEYDAILKNNTWSLVKLPACRIPVGCKWLFKLKRNLDGSVNRYKASLIAKGYSQVSGYDFTDTFSPVVKFSTFNVVLALAVSNDWELRHVDVNNAFLNGDLDERALYGLRQAPRSWHAKLRANLVQIGFIASQADPSLFISRRDDGDIYVLVYVDDIVITGQSSNSIQDVVQLLSARLSIVGSLLYVCHTLHDLSYSVGRVAQFMHAPREAHMVAVKRILRYLADDRRSVSRYGVFVGSCLVTWSSKKQKTVSRSTMEAEYKCVADTATEVTWVSALLADLGVTPRQEPIIWCDNTGAVALSANPDYHTQSKHIDLDVHFVREKVASGQMRVNYVPAPHQLADGFTKPMSKAAFEDFRIKVGVGPHAAPGLQHMTMDDLSRNINEPNAHERRYTGEDGFEISVPSDNALDLAKAILEKFEGRVGFTSSGPPPRSHSEIQDEKGNNIGEITSGGFSPCPKKNIAMGYVKSGLHKAGTKAKILVRGKAYDGVVTKMPFVPTKYYKPS
ncbi:Aminomethyltransferase [Hibiscus syriacus]|uniref:Aminomethyltransferase n=1 Tax=Hibiscus syriacus TaxID=106335 RepID=A0A6A2ZY21_HIBSY|nr:Aminomethyltransferase [Hibiscus syriacus]